ncbi:PilW family protein [Paraburkholderia lycopersici]|uniref:Type IV pilus assembly protein PilW n=1 Tax=Paraburkholderia lycopersici TaxID=416944 RepID=A0A1G6KD11_9BURK|nr:PilW family protein [Paraburkholderia lycopersici]SDC28807.1 type IV pilus assembly protein PilW [Paraburkholderia lycopersici]
MNKRRAAVCRQGGHTLLELTIAIALGLVVTLGALSAYRAQRQAFAYASDATRIHEAGMNALMLVGEQIQMAGFVAADARAPLAAPAIFGCTAGRPAGADAVLACESLSSRSDGLAVRYQGDGISTWPATSGQVTDCLGQAVGAAGVEVVNRYHAKASSSTGEPELYCEGSGKVGTAQPLVEGVERLRLRYWIAGAAQALDASALTREQWASVVAVDLCVLVRGATFPRRTRYLDCDGAQAFGADGRARQAFWRHVVLRNVAQAPS